ncbi:hypothetical protein [Acidiphilium sp. 34-64-41]|nr:hypothetical protein [Acidiphilium sp. 34-64-41]
MFSSISRTITGIAVATSLTITGAAYANPSMLKTFQFDHPIFQQC